VERRADARVRPPRYCPFQGMFAAGSRLPFVPLQGGARRRLYLLGAVVGLVLIPVAAVAAARFYAEPA
jgi:hypothetical protein